MTITNVTIMKKLGILWELPKCGTEIRSEKIQFKNGTDRQAWMHSRHECEFVKSAVSMKCNKLSYAYNFSFRVPVRISKILSFYKVILFSWVWVPW